MRTVFVVDEPQLQSLPSTTRTAALVELQRLFDFVGQIPKEKAVTVQALPPSGFPEAPDLSDAVVRLTDSGLSAELQDAFRKQLANIKEALRAAGRSTAGVSTPKRFEASPEKLGIASSIKDTSAGFAFCVMGSFVHLPDTIDAYVDDTTQDQADIDKRKKAIGDDLAKYAKYAMTAQALHDTHDELIHQNRSNPSKWVTDQDNLGVFIGRVMAHEARHLFVPAHAATGLGADSPEATDDKNFASFSKDDQRAIVLALNAFEGKQKGQQLLPVFPKSVRSDPDSFPF